MIWVGTSGWQYRDWRGRFYPKELPQDQWLAWYADRFPTVEVNNTFYRLPERSTFERWRDQTPSGTMISVKVSRYLTHTLRLRDPREPIERLWSRVEALGTRLGALLFQLPPRFGAEPERLRAVLSFLPAGVEAAFEFRDPSWHRPEVYRVLEERNAALVWADRLGQDPAPPQTADHAYIRFHQGAETEPGYPDDVLHRAADEIARFDVRTVRVYFNNDQGGAATRNAETMAELLRERLGDDVATSGRLWMTTKGER
jgi:uncharacterized protein YecE (DUF72 family)